MNRADILRMAREVGAIKHEHHEWWNFMEGDLERFAELVAKAEREACAKMCDEMADWHFEKHTSTTISTHDYQIGIVRGFVNATNAIRARSKT